MISVGVRDLKNQLSRYIQYVKRGERVLITEHNRIVAELSLPKEEQQDDTVENALEALAASGKLQKAQRNTSVAPAGITAPDLDWIAVYRENRDEE